MTRSSTICQAVLWSFVVFLATTMAGHAGTATIQFALGETPEVPEGSVGILVADRNADGFLPLSDETVPGTIVAPGQTIGSSDDVIVGLVHASSAGFGGHTGFSDIFADIDYEAFGIAPGMPLIFYWFPGMMFSGESLETGSPFYSFRSDTVSAGGDMGYAVPAVTGVYRLVHVSPEAGGDFEGGIGTLSEVVGFPSSQFSDALDTPGRNWSSGGALAWSVGNSETHDGVDAARSGAIFDGEETWLESSFFGPGTLNFWWKVSSQQDADFLELKIDGILRQAISGEQDWQAMSVEVAGPGMHRVRFRYAKDATLSSGADRGWVDEVGFTPAAPVPLPESLDVDSLTIQTGGDAEWTGSTIPSHDGVDSAGSGEVDDGQSSAMDVVVSGPAQIRFWWRVSSEADSDTLGFLVDGNPVAEISGEQDWQEFVYESTDSSSHTLRWLYAKDGEGSAGADAGWVDELLIVPFPSLAEGLDQDTRSIATGGASVWRGRESPAHDGVDSGQSGPVGQGEESWFEIEVSADTIVSWWWKISASNANRLSIEVDGTESARISGDTDWRREELILQAGVHTLRWIYSNHDGNSVGADAGWVDELTITRLPTLAEAIDRDSLDVLTGGSQPWQPQTGITRDGVDAAQSGDVGNSQESWMEATFFGAGDLEFDWKVSSEGSFDFLELWIDGVRRERISGEQDWARVTVPVEGEGPHIVRWTYRKDGSVTRSADLGWVDRVSFAAIQFGEWADLFSLVGNQRLLDSNGDGDHTTLLEEFAFNLDPTQNDTHYLEGMTGSSGLPIGRLVDAGGGHKRLEVEYVRRKDTKGQLVYTVEFASGLNDDEEPTDDWQDSTATPVISSIDAVWERVTVTDEATTATHPRRFGRVRLDFEESDE